MFKDKNLEYLYEKILAGKRVNFVDGKVILQSDDLCGLGFLANHIREKFTGKRITFVLNQQINPTNICVYSCRFCSFAKKKNDSQAYALNIEEILERVSQGVEQGVKEVHLTSALHPDWKYETYLEIIRNIKDKFPHLQIKAYTAVEIDWFTKISQKDVQAVLEDLLSVGVNLLPGGGAEIFSPRVREILCPSKIGKERWLEIHRKAHLLKLKSNATMLYGHIETEEELINHLLALRELQDETNGFLAFVPLAFQSVGKDIVARAPSAIVDLKVIALSRLLLDNFVYIKAYWVTLGDEIAQIALNFGANDLDGTIGEERIAHSGGAESPPAHPKEELIELIKESGLLPVERDGLHNEIKIYSQNW